MIIQCIFWQDCDVNSGGCCEINEYNRPSHGVCLKACTKYDGPSRGLGDTVHKTIKTVTLGKAKHCETCAERRVRLNKKFSYAN